MSMISEAHQKITTAHLSRLAYLYVRQSTLRQVFECVIHAMSVHDFTACRSSISRQAGQGFHAMSVQRFMACRSSS
jgi:hypothetical protein